MGFFRRWGIVEVGVFRVFFVYFFVLSFLCFFLILGFIGRSSFVRMCRVCFFCIIWFWKCFYNFEFFFFVKR